MGVQPALGYYSDFLAFRHRACTAFLPPTGLITSRPSTQGASVWAWQARHSATRWSRSKSEPGPLDHMVHVQPTPPPAGLAAPPGAAPHFGTDDLPLLGGRTLTSRRSRFIGSARPPSNNWVPPILRRPVHHAKSKPTVPERRNDQPAGCERASVSSWHARHSATRRSRSKSGPQKLFEVSRAAYARRLLPL
jgi:hypothetical protein